MFSFRPLGCYILLMSSGGHGFLIPLQALELKERNPLDKAIRGLARPIEIRNDIGHLMMRDHGQELYRLILRVARKF